MLEKHTSYTTDWNAAQRHGEIILSTKKYCNFSQYEGFNFDDTVLTNISLASFLWDMLTVQTQIRCQRMWRLIRVSTVFASKI